MGLTTLTGPHAIIYGRSCMVLVPFESWHKNLPPWCIFCYLSWIERAWETETWWKCHFFRGFDHFDWAWCHQLWSEVKYFCIFEFLGQKARNKELFRFLEWFLGIEIELFQKMWKFPQIPIQIGVNFRIFRRIHWRVPRSFLYKTASNSRYLYDFVRKNVWASHSNFLKVLYYTYFSRGKQDKILVVLP